MDYQVQGLNWRAVHSFDLTVWQWGLAALGAFLVGVAKTGVPGLGIFNVAIYAMILPAREASGVVLPILIAADIVAVAMYRRHTEWKYLWRLFPWAIGGILLGWLAVGRINSAQVEWLVGGILATMVAVHLWRKKYAGENIPTNLAFAASIGILGGFTTMVANAAGPVMTLFLLAMRLPKLAFIGTSAWYFLLLNLFKVPFSAQIGLINAASLRFDAPLMLCAIGGALCGKKLLPHINEKMFETVALSFTVLAALKLLFWRVVFG